MTCRPLALAVACAALLAPAVSAAAPQPAPRALTLRLVDLSRGYALPLGGCEAEPALAEGVRFANRNCVIEFGRAWTPPGAAPGPAIVISAAAVFPTAKRAAAVLAYPRLVASLAFDPDREDFEVVRPAPAIGDEAVLLHAADGSAVVVWRSGAVLAALLAGNGLREHGDVDPQVALALAAAQQERIASPRPFTASDDDDSEVALDDPGLGLPVWWLGRRLPQQGRLPSLRLLASLSGELLGERDFGPVLTYGRRGASADVELVLAQPSLLHRPSMRRELRRMRRDSCMRIQRLAHAHGRATIFQRSPRCPKLRVKDTADALFDTTAIVVLPGVVVLAYADDCVHCHGPVSRYESPGGMRRMVRALRLRPPNVVLAP